MARLITPAGATIGGVVADTSGGKRKVACAAATASVVQVVRFDGPRMR